MHQPIKDYLEDYLRDPGDRSIPGDFQAHLMSCGACTKELEALSTQTTLLRSLRLTDSPEPGAGFYARVLNRIDEREVDSIWSVLLEPAFGRRLAFTCGALVLVLGTYLVGAESGEYNLLPSVSVSQGQPNSAQGDGEVRPQERNAVLVNLVSYQE